MRIGGVEFALAGPILADTDADENLVLDEPYTRFDNSKRLALNAYGEGPFARLRTSPLPDEPGVYAIRDGGDLLYIGRARDSIKRRWGPQGYAVIHPRNCYVGGQSTNCRLNRLITQRLTRAEPLELWVHPVADPVPVESGLISRLRPPWNLRG